VVRLLLYCRQFTGSTLPHRAMPKYLRVKEEANSGNVVSPGFRVRAQCSGLSAHAAGILQAL
jgi:hypothetical protein